MRTIIIGSGITGSILARLIPGAVVYDKAQNPGGRISSSIRKKEERFDKGATVFKDEIEYLQNGEIKTFSFIDLLVKLSPEIKIVPHRTYPNAFHPATCMMDICSKLLDHSETHWHEKLESVTKSRSGDWELKFENGRKDNCDELFLTAPIPQSLSCLKNSGTMQTWDDFIKFRGEYRSTLTLTGVWRDLDTSILDKAHNLSQITLFHKNQDVEYISLESEKYNYKNPLIITIQFSSSFSSKNLERWIDSEKRPMPYVINSSPHFFNFVFDQLGLPELKNQIPNEIRAHRWRYSAADFPLFERHEMIDLEKEKYREYLELCKSNRLWIAGDWIWGSRMVLAAFGALQVAKSSHPEISF